MDCGHLLRHRSIVFKGTQSPLEPDRPGHQFPHFENSSPQYEMKAQAEIRLKLRCVLLEFQSFTETPLFEYAFAHPMIAELLRAEGARVEPHTLENLVTY